MRQHLLAVVAVALLASPLHAQPAASGTALLDRAFVHFNRREFVAAQQAFSALVNRPDLSMAERAKALRGLGAALFEQNRRVEAAQTLDLALEAAIALGDRSEQGWTRRYIGALRYGEGLGDQARALWHAARDDFVASVDLRGEFQANDDLALLTQGLEQRPLVERCLAIALELDDPLLEARARRRWGPALLHAAKPGPALVELERAVALMREAGPAAQGYLADALAQLGWALRSHGAFDRAVLVHREALRMARARADLNAQVWNNQGLGTALTELRRFPEAEAAMRRGLDAARATGAATSIRLLTESVAWVALIRQHWAEAARLLESAIQLPGVDVSVIPLVHVARAYRGLHRLDDALAAATRAVTLARRRGLVDNELRALIELAQIQEAQSDLAAAQETIDSVVSRLEVYRAELAPQDLLKQGFGDRFVDAYGIAVRVLMRGGHVAEALTAAERLRSRAFADLLASRRVREAEEAEVESGAWALGGPRRVPPAAGVRADNSRAHPAMDSGALAGLARRLDTTLVIYWISGEGSFAWVVQPTGATFGVALALTPAQARRAVGQVADGSPDVAIDRTSPTSASTRVASRAPYRALHTQLWAPIERWLPRTADARVTIVPHGPLFALPFGALMDSRGRYVVERYALHYAASGTVLAEASAARPGASDRSGDLVVADPQPLSPAPGLALPMLTAARAEARAVASMLGPRVEMLVGRRASEPAVRAALAGASLVHFATHAVVSDVDPLGSHLLLAAAAGDGPRLERDGRLTASEVAGLTLRADLVVLGACRSARGRVSSDGIAGLTRAFMAAGAPSVVATLWDVSDHATARVMTQFYAGYLTGTSKDGALRAAQLALLRDLRAGRVRRKVGETTLTYAEHPHLWAGAILIGAPSR